ncbi:MAG: uracil-DNA glycosylase family protein [Minwuia sp.]|uniref:uracil-DNA glycosylase family protein n=1 Tax=Minwuia sp. TaxID=2493630 RepID=UPI003A8B7849
MTEPLEPLLAAVRACRICADSLPEGPLPLLRADRGARIAIAGQAPGIRVHRTGTPWNDPSGDRLRDWLGVDRDTFYDTSKFAIVPMGFCYPGTVKGKGDLPPRPECRATWHDRIFAALPEIELTLCIGQYAIDYHMPDLKRPTLTETVRNWRQALPRRLPMPHPSGRNNLWLRRNPFFEAEVLPELRRRVAGLI